jgi:FtsZ-binding cell division protein ZapB
VRQGKRWGEKGGIMMDTKYLAEIKARLDAGRIPMKSDMEALLAEVERLQNVVKIQRASCSLVETAKAANIVDGIAAKDQQIATLKKEIEQLAEERDAAKRKKDELEAFYEQLCRNIAQEASK